MSFTLDGTTLIVLGLVVLALVALFAVWMARRRKSRALRRDFGPEYEHQVAATGSRATAENELEARRRRVKRYQLRDLDPADRERFTVQWRELQKRFVDHPSAAVDEAAMLVEEAMGGRGYPLGEIHQQEADLSVHYPREVQDYRRARVISSRNRRGQASTEELREAIVCYRRLFAHLVGVDEHVHAERAS
jgi:FtsZ-interacting cell division protein ZipA